MRPRNIFLPLAVAAACALGGTAAAQSAETISTVAGTGSPGFSGDGGPATAAQLFHPSDVAALGGGSFLIADSGNHRIRRVDAGGSISTVAGSGTPGFRPDQLSDPRGVAAAPDGAFLVADTGNHVIRRVEPNGATSVVAGALTAPGGFRDGPATDGAQFSFPHDVAVLADGSLLVADTGNSRVRRVADGNVTTVAGPEGLSAPTSVTPVAGGAFVVADRGNNVVRRVNADGTVETVAGTGTAGFGGDGGPATAAQLNAPEGVAVRGDGSLLIGDSGNMRVREVDLVGRIRTLAGTGGQGSSGDGGPATSAQLGSPRGIAVDGDRIRIAEYLNHRMRDVQAAPGGGGGPTATITDQPPAVPPPAVTRPELGRTLVAGRISGTVRVRPRGSRRFINLEGSDAFPLGSELDSSRGVAAVFFTTDEQGTDASAFAAQGRFLTAQPRKRDAGQRPGELRLSSPISGCLSPRLASRASKARAAGAPVASAAARRRGRKLRVSARGKIKTKGRYGSAIVKGTQWIVRDLCRGAASGTQFKVSEGKVLVRDDVRRRNVLVRAGESYFARARR